MYYIREADIADVAAIHEIAHQTWWPTYRPILSDEQITYMLSVLYSEEKLHEQIANHEQTFLILTEESMPVAFAAYSPRSENPEVYKLHKLYCLPQTQGKGYGVALINAVEIRVLAAGKQLLDLNVNRFNKARSFYEKAGFKVIYEEDIAIGPYWMNDFVMQKSLVKAF